MLEEWKEPGSEGGPEPGSSILIRDLQAKLNDARPAGAGYCAEATGKRPCAVYLLRGRIYVACRKEGCLQAGTKDVAGRGIDVPVEHVEEGGLEIDGGFFADEMCFLSNSEVFISSTVRTGGR